MYISLKVLTSPVPPWKQKVFNFLGEQFYLAGGFNQFQKY